MITRRNTIQKELIRTAVYDMKRHVTANEVYDFLKETYPQLEREQYIETLIYWQKKNFEKS